jgi:hypothetical protein
LPNIPAFPAVPIFLSKYIRLVHYTPRDCKQCFFFFMSSISSEVSVDILVEWLMLLLQNLQMNKCLESLLC